MGAWERTISNLDERIRADLLDMVAIRGGLPGLVAFVLVVAFAAIFAIRGIRQIRHSVQFEAPNHLKIHVSVVPWASSIV